MVDRIKHAPIETNKPGDQGSCARQLRTKSRVILQAIGHGFHDVQQAQRRIGTQQRLDVPNHDSDTCAA